MTQELRKPHSFMFNEGIIKHELRQAAEELRNRIPTSSMKESRKPNSDKFHGDIAKNEFRQV